MYYFFYFYINTLSINMDLMHLCYSKAVYFVCQIKSVFCAFHKSLSGSTEGPAAAANPHCISSSNKACIHI